MLAATALCAVALITSVEDVTNSLLGVAIVFMGGLLVLIPKLFNLISTLIDVKTQEIRDSIHHARDSIQEDIKAPCKETNEKTPRDGTPGV
jgi:hypothetical protein